MITPPTPLSLIRRRRKRRTIMASALASVLIAAACGGAMNYSEDARFSADLGIVDGLDPLTIGKRHFANRNFGLAIEAFEEARQIAPQSVNVLNALAVSYEEIGRSDLADSYFLEALDADPSSAQTYNNWAMVHMGRGNPDKAQQLLAEAARLAPGDPVVSDNLARAGASTVMTDAVASAAPPPGALTTLIAELQGTGAGPWEPTIRSVAPHVSFLETMSPGTTPGAAGAFPTVLYPQVAAADFMPLPDPSEAQAPAPPAIPVAPVVGFDLDDPAAAEAALGQLAASEAGRTVVPYGAAEPSGGVVVRPGGSSLATLSNGLTGLEPAQAGLVLPAAISPGSQFVSVDPVVADRPQPIAVGQWSLRTGEGAVGNQPDGGAGIFVQVATAPTNLPAGVGFVTLGSTIHEAPERTVITPVSQGPLGDAVTLAAARTGLMDPDSDQGGVPAGSAVSITDAAARIPVVLASLQVGVEYREDSAALPPMVPELPPLAGQIPAVGDATRRVPLVVAMLTPAAPVAFEAPVVDNSVAASLPLATAARIPTVVAMLALAESASDDEQGHANTDSQD